MVKRMLLRLTIASVMSILVASNSFAQGGCWVDNGLHTCQVDTVTCDPPVGGTCQFLYEQGTGEVANTITEWNVFEGGDDYPIDGTSYDLICERHSPCVPTLDMNGNVTGCGPDLTNVTEVSGGTAGNLNYDLPCFSWQESEEDDDD